MALRKRNLYAGPEKLFKISRSKIDSYINCPRCFYMDRVEGLKRPSMPGFTLNIAVDKLLKNEFDQFRTKQAPHPIMTEYGIDAVPAQHELLDQWRNNFKGVEGKLDKYNLLISGAIDDLWVTSGNQYIIVDYKATAKKDDMKELGDEKWHNTYRRQLEIYQWLVRKNGLEVSNSAYFLYCNGIGSMDTFDKKLEFRTTIIEYVGDDRWVDGVIQEIYECLNAGKRPNSRDDCEHCGYISDIDSLRSSK